MNIIDEVILDLILMIFPILVYFMYNCYRELCMEKYNQTLLGVALVSSMYFCLKFGHVKENIFSLLFCNLPVIVAYLKKQPGVAILLSFIVVIYVFYVTNFNVVLLILKFLIYFVIYILGRKRNIKDNTFILAIVVIQGFFLSFDYFMMIHDNNIFSILQMLVVMLLFYILPFSLLHLFRLADQITSLYLTVSELEKDKQLKNSLFKITHEVKNPIAVCKGYLDMMDIYNQEQVEKYIPIIRGEIVRSLDIMSDFMEFSKIKVDKEIIDINMLLEDIGDELKILMHNRKIVFQSHILNDEIYIEGDYNRLKQVFINLFKNSLEAISDEGSIQMITHVLKGRYYIEIIDDGIGMDDDTLVNVKEMFFTTKVKGSGLGVSLSNEIIKAHQGSIDYYSKLGHGTKVVVKLPIAML